MKYKRVLLKLSGEYLGGDKGYGIDFDILMDVAKKIKKCASLGIEIGIVVGGGNIWRGRNNKEFNSSTSDNIGMLATTMNALALNDALLQVSQDSIVLSSVEMNKMVEFYSNNKAINCLKEGKVVIFAGGTGNPFFSTDTAASLRGIEIDADIILKATNVNGVYTGDPKVDKDATLIKELSYIDILSKRLKVLDATATSLCMDNDIPILVFNMGIDNNLEDAMMGKDIGTIIKNM